MLFESQGSKVKVAVWSMIFNYVFTVQMVMIMTDGRLRCSRQWPKDPEGMRCIWCLAFFETFVYQGRLAAIFELDEMQSSHSPCQVRSALDFVGDLIVNSRITKMRRELYVAENQDLFLSCSKAGKGLPLLPTVRDFGWQLLCALRLLRTARLITLRCQAGEFAAGSRLLRVEFMISLICVWM